MKTALKLLIALGVVAGLGWAFRSVNLPPEERSVRV